MAIPAPPASAALQVGQDLPAALEALQTSLDALRSAVGTTIDELPEGTAKAAIEARATKVELDTAVLATTGADISTYLTKAEGAAIYEDIANSGLNAEFASTASRNVTTPAVVKSASNPIFDVADSALASMFWPWVLRVDGILGSPADTYYMWYSSDHGSGEIALATAPSPEGPWTEVGVVYTDTVVGSQTETPSVIWNEDESLLFMYYQQVGLGTGQSTALATSPDGVTWTRVGKVVDIVLATDQPGDGHTGYFRPFRIGNRWFGYSLLSGQGMGHAAIWQSANGRDWVMDPRPLEPNTHLTGHINTRIYWHQGQPVRWRGGLWWIGIMGPFVSGLEPGAKMVIAAPLADNMRQLLAPPTIIMEGDDVAWETTDLRSCAVMVDEGRMYIYYATEDKFGVAVGV